MLIHKPNLISKTLLLGILFPVRMNNKFHTFHIVQISPWPVMTAISISSLLSSIVLWNTHSNIYILEFSIILTSIISFIWWKDVIRETKNQGFHFNLVIKGLKMGIILFITSEVIFFVSFFWTYFHRGIRPNIEMGQIWPPNSIEAFNPINIPLLNTIILLSSGVSITWSHHEILKNNFKKANISLILTVILGIYFSFLQGIEYQEAEFSISDSVYGSTFFIATGFHGLHVIVGTSFLLTCLIRNLKKEISYIHLVGFEAAAWYWHFVDVVWLFLYIRIYWWGS